MRIRQTILFSRKYLSVNEKCSVIMSGTRIQPTIEWKPVTEICVYQNRRVIESYVNIITTRGFILSIYTFELDQNNAENKKMLRTKKWSFRWNWQIRPRGPSRYRSIMMNFASNWKISSIFPTYNGISARNTFIWSIYVRAHLKRYFSCEGYFSFSGHTLLGSILIRHYVPLNFESVL